MKFETSIKIALLSIIGYVISCKKNSLEQIEKDKTVIITPIVIPKVPTNPTTPVDTICDTCVTYTLNVKRIFETRCGGASSSNCHGSPNFSVGQLNNYANAKSFAMNPQLIKAVKHAPGAEPMPQGGAKIPQAQIDTIQFWINQNFPQ